MRRGGLFSDIAGVIVTILGGILSVCVLLYLLKMIGIDVNLGEILRDGIYQIRDAIRTLKQSF